MSAAASTKSKCRKFPQCNSPNYEVRTAREFAALTSYESGNYNALHEAQGLRSFLFVNESFSAESYMEEAAVLGTFS